MKISKSKQELARIISENGGWRDGAKWAAQCKSDVTVSFYSGCEPYRDGDCWRGEHLDGTEIKILNLMPNWHQTILSREEYFFLCKNQALEDALDEPMVESNPTIEQLAADYQQAAMLAEIKQNDADAAKADADARLKALELAGEALGLLVSPITAKQEPELVIEVKVGDEVECVESNIKRDKYRGMVGRLHSIDESETSTPYLVDFGGNARIWCHEVKFISRP